MNHLTWDAVKELLATAPVAKRAGMTNTEIALTLNLPAGHVGRVANLTLIMWEAGEIDRTPDSMQNGDRRAGSPWRYFAKRP